MKSGLAWCPECQKNKPENGHDLHDVVLMRHDWRQADRPHIDDPIPKTLMCHECFRRIRAEFGPLAPSWDSRGRKYLPERTDG